jgi:hypothetical protein
MNTVVGNDPFVEAEIGEVGKELKDEQGRVSAMRGVCRIGLIPRC